MIVVSTPTGEIGHQVVADLLAAGIEPVRVIARDPSRLDATVRNRVEVLEGSHGDPRTIDRALAGADSLFWVVPPDVTAPDVYAQYLDFTRPVTEALTRRGVERVVVVSALGREVPGDAGLITASLRMVDLIGKTGIAYRSLTMPGFMENVLRQVGSIRDMGLLFGSIRPNLKMPATACRDVAAAAARLLLDHSWSGQEELPLLGSEDISFDQMAEIISEVIGKPVSYRHIPFDAERAQMLEHGASEGFADGMLKMMVAKDNGLDTHASRTPETTTPTGFRQWCEEILKPALDA